LKKLVVRECPICNEAIVTAVHIPAISRLVEAYAGKVSLETASICSGYEPPVYPPIEHNADSFVEPEAIDYPPPKTA
jgi:hypothetical protein